MLGHSAGAPAMAPSAVMAGLVPAIPISKGVALHSIGITGTRPVMTSHVAFAHSPGALA
ncbi:hypothetical protein J4G37_14080 [Microvirga sp. 3-52]|nr:hypothetical protein [Microvirga sp. 3-52]